MNCLIANPGIFTTSMILVNDTRDIKKLYFFLSADSEEMPVHVAPVNVNGSAFMLAPQPSIIIPGLLPSITSIQPLIHFITRQAKGFPLS